MRNAGDLVRSEGSIQSLERVAAVLRVLADEGLGAARRCKQGRFRVQELRDQDSNLEPTG